MENLNPLQLSFLMDIPKERAFVLFTKASNKKKESERVDFNMKDAIRSWTEPIESLSKAVNINLSWIIEDIQANFTKNKSCMDYVFKKLNEKVRPDSRGFYPLTIGIPKEVKSFITEDQYHKIKLVSTEYLPEKTQELMKKHKIQIR